jgi:2-keto-4-pentenoate hydratase/2-oxohepta-3-ene-1,7-dioic acid hydratase in catechol pathway
VGASFTPQQFLRPGDVVEAAIERIGTLRNPVVDAR